MGGMLKPAIQEHSPASTNNNILNRFIAVNTDKIRRVRESITRRQRDLLDSLALLFHVNNRTLPAYVSDDTPCGIFDYVPSEHALKTAKRLEASFVHKQQSVQRCDIHGLYLMGSPGTVGYSKSSDLDVWLVHDSRLNEKQLGELATKAEKIEVLAARIGLEMHFFVFDAARFRSGESITLSAESSGSSQHYLLLDEFYRSGLLLAGMKPLWWCVPPEAERNYEEYVNNAAQSKQISEHDFVDFGGLKSLPADEFFGAAVWHLYKSIDSPYKSVLKMLLMETYTATYPHGDLLCHRYKEAIIGGVTSINELDPYMLMYRKVEEYLMQANDSARLDLLRRSFYIKTNVRLSKDIDRHNTGWQREMLTALTKDWGWNKADIYHIDRREEWKILTAKTERQALINALRQTYAALSNFARSHGENQKITQTDLNVLGRKLYVAYQRKPAKIDVITRGICVNPSETSLSLHRVADAEQRSSWKLYLGAVTPSDSAREKPLLQASGLAELLAWCHFNRLADANTSWHIDDPQNVVSVADLQKAIAAIKASFPSNAIKHNNSRELVEPPRPRIALLLVNFGIHPFGGKVSRTGILTSARTDAFQFSGSYINLIQSVDLILVTRWGEIYVHHFTGVSSILDAVSEYLQLATPFGSFKPPRIEVCCLSKDYTQPITKRVFEYANDIVAKMCAPEIDIDCEYIVQIEKAYYGVTAKDGKPHYNHYPNYGALIKGLGNPRQGFSRIEFDPGCSNIDLIRYVCDQNRSGVIQLFLLERGKEVELYVLDEHGALFTRRQECYRVDTIFDHYLEFFDNLLDHYDEHPDVIDTEPDREPIEMFRLQPRPHNVFLLAKYNAARKPASEYLPIRVFVDIDENRNQQFTIFCEDEEFSTNVYGGRLFVAIAEFILGRRANAEAYPIYISDLELSNRFKDQRGIVSQQTIHLLNYKKRIEDELTRALHIYVSKDKP